MKTLGAAVMMNAGWCLCGRSEDGHRVYPALVNSQNASVRAAVAQTEWAVLLVCSADKIEFPA